MSKSTIIRKSCGHVGVVRGNYIWDSVVCTLCEENKMPSEAKILARADVDELPQMTGKRLEQWLAARLDEVERRNRNDKPE